VTGMTKSLCGHYRRTTEEMSLKAFPFKTVSDGGDVTSSRRKNVPQPPGISGDRKSSVADGLEYKDMNWLAILNGAIFLF